MANDAQDPKIGRPADIWAARSDSPDSEQDTEGHMHAARGTDNPIGQPADLRVARGDTPDSDSDDDVEGHIFVQRGDGTVEEGDLGGAKDAFSF